MKRLNMTFVGLLCVGVLFSAGALFNLPKTELYLAAGGIFALSYWPLFIYIQRHLDPNYKFKDGVREYTGTFVFVMVLVALIFTGTKDYLDNAISNFREQSKGF